jgi:hypothetical protein
LKAIRFFEYLSNIHTFLDIVHFDLSNNIFHYCLPPEVFLFYWIFFVFQFKTPPKII